MLSYLGIQANGDYNPLVLFVRFRPANYQRILHMPALLKISETFRVDLRATSLATSWFLILQCLWP